MKDFTPSYGVEFEGYFEQVPVTTPKYSKITGTTLLKNGNKKFDFITTERDDIAASAEIESFKTCSAVRQTTTVCNTLEHKVIVNYLSSGVFKLPANGSLKWYNDDKYRVHYCQSGWQTEGQWRSATLNELGLQYISPLRTYCSAAFSSKGSWSTNKYFPLVIIEDLELSESYYFIIEASFGWQIELGIYDDGNTQNLFVSMDSANQWNDGWCKTLEKGEGYTSFPCVYGRTKGDVNDALREITKYRREASLVPTGRPAPLVFNDYMGALWAMPTDKKLIPLIDKAQKLGAEYFCIDAGWYGLFGDIGIKNPERGLGRWEKDDSLFGDMGLKGILDYIISKNMKPGVWLEIDAFETSVKNDALDESCFVKRNGGVLGAPRGFLDLRNPKARKYILSVFDELYNMGVRYIKNDYNHTTGIGCDSKSGNFSTGLQELACAFYSIIDEVKEKHPDMLIENCASGAQRSDDEITKHFDLVNSSDQMEYQLNPSIVSGFIACSIPEKAGAWCYPYLLPYTDKDTKLEEYFSDEYKSARADGEETIFNVVTSLTSTMYISGHADHLDKLNFDLYCEGTSLFKEERDFICHSYPIYPGGFFRMSDRGIFSFGLIDEANSKIFLYVWRIGGEGENGAIDISRWCRKSSAAEMIYPNAGYDVPYCLDTKSGILTVTLNNEYSARLFRISI